MAGRRRMWGFDDAERQLLVDATTQLPELRAVIDRAEQRAEFRELWVVQASVRELDEMYSLVEALTDGTRSRRRLDLLDGLRGSLCTAIDGF